MDENLIMGLTSVEDKRVSIKDIFDFVLRRQDIEQKTNLSNDNISAIIKMRAVNDHLKRYFGFTIELYDTLIDEKRINVISLYGQGRRDILQIIKNMQTQVNENDEKDKRII
jgi:hypothetical protein